MNPGMKSRMIKFDGFVKSRIDRICHFVLLSLSFRPQGEIFIILFLGSWVPQKSIS